MEEIVKRLNEIKSEMMAENADIDALTKETDELLNRKKALEEQQAQQINRDKLSAMVDEGLLEPKKIGIVENDKDNMIERKAFMEYVQKGVRSDAIKRADNPTQSSDLGVMIPHTVQQEIITEIEKLHGTLYSRVKKTAIPGGVEYPIGSFGATFKRIAETGTGSAPTDRQNGGRVTGSVVFKYNIGEIRLSKTLLQSLLTVPAFERELAKVIAEAFLKAMDNEILNGVPENKEMEGILKKTGVKTIEVTEDEIKDWKNLYKKIMAKLPLSLLNAPFEYAMSSGTFMSNFMTLANDNNTPVGQFVDYNGTTSARINGHEVVMVEPELFPDFDSITKSGDVFGMLWLPNQAYCINSNMQFTVKQYEDNEKNEIVTKALVVNDGKVLRPDLIYLLKKKTTGTAGA